MCKIIDAQRFESIIDLSACASQVLSLHIFTPIVVDNASATGTHIAYEIWSAVRHSVVSRLRWYVQQGQASTMCCFVCSMRTSVGKAATHWNLCRTRATNYSGSRITLEAVNAMRLYP